MIGKLLLEVLLVGSNGSSKLREVSCSQDLLELDFKVCRDAEDRSFTISVVDDVEGRAEGPQNLVGLLDSL